MRKLLRLTNCLVGRLKVEDRFRSRIYQTLARIERLPLRTEPASKMVSLLLYPFGKRLNLSSSDVIKHFLMAVKHYFDTSHLTVSKQYMIFCILAA